VSYPTAPSVQEALIKPSAITLIQKQGHHDVAILEFSVENESALTVLKTNMPISFKWTKNGYSKEWVGYISSVSAEHSPTPRKRMQIHCIGSAFSLKARKPRIFTNKTIPQVVEALVKEAGLAFNGDSHPRVFPQISIAGQSYWEWIREQAKRIGYAVHVDGTTVYFKRLDSMIDTFSKDTALLSYFANEFPTDVLLHDRTLDYFKFHNGEYIEGSELRNNKSVGGVDPVTGKIISASKKASAAGKRSRKVVNETFFEEQRTDQVVHDTVSATTAAEGSAHNARFVTPAKVKCQGDARIRPYAPVYVNGISEQVDGHWIVLQATHYMTIGGEYQIEMDVATDGSGKNNPTATRSTDPHLIGTIDIAAALANGGTPVTTPGYTKSRLAIKTPVVSESQQGQNRSRAVWVNGPKPKRRVY
jgi:phage protein D